MTADSLTVTIGRKTILDSVTFAATDEVLGIAGRNGAGKSTLLRTIESAAWRARRDIDIGPRTGRGRASVGYLPQRFSLPRSLTVRQFVEYTAWIKNVPTVSASAAAALRATHLMEFSEQTIRHVSGGVAQRTGFASVLVDEPDVLLLDEPTTGVDIQQREIMRGIIAAQSRRRVTILSSHLSEDLEQLCDRVLVLGHGRMRFLGTIEEALAATGTSDLADALLSLSAGRE